MKALLTIFILASGASPELEAQLRAMQTRDGAEYVEARDAVRALGPAALPAVRARLEAAEWTRLTWERDVAAAIAEGWLSREDELASVYALRGLDPAHYTKRRRPEPIATPELRRLRDAAPILIEIVLKTHAEDPKLSDPERLALLSGAVEVLGSSGHPAAPFALEQVLAGGGHGTALRTTAATALGETRSPIAFTTLRRLAAASDEALSVRGAALQGVARLRTEEAARFLVQVAQETRDATLRPAAIRALGHLASSWAWGNLDATRGERVRRLVSRALVDQLLEDDAGSVELHLVEALAMVRHPSAAAALARALDADLEASTRARVKLAKEHLELTLRRK